MASHSSSLAVESREPQSSRGARRSRREGGVPGVIYGGGQDPVPIIVDDRVLRHALAERGAVLDLSVDGAKATPVVLKDTQRHPVRNQIMHIDLLRVDLKQKIEQPVPLELIDVEDAEGIRLGGVLEHMVREVTVEALPADIPESIRLSIKDIAAGDNATLEIAEIPAGVRLVDDPTTVAVSLRIPRVQRTEEGEEVTLVEGGATPEEIADVEAGGAEAGAESSEDDAPETSSEGAGA